MKSSGAKFRQLLEQGHLLQIPGAITAYNALQAESTGFQALYLSGAGVANAGWGMPDLATTNLYDVAYEARRILSACSLPLLVDIDTGFGNALMLKRTIQTLNQAGVAAIHLEDQLHQNKRCGHRPGKQLVTCEEMCERIIIACESRLDPSFFVMARCDACASEGLEKTIQRCLAYQKAGADGIFAEAFTSLEQYKQLTDAISIPVLANITENGHTPLFSTQELEQAGVAMALYPLTAFRAMSQAALQTYQTLFEEGTQKNLLSQLQTREDLYHTINYHQCEELIDKDS